MGRPKGSKNKPKNNALELSEKMVAAKKLETSKKYTAYKRDRRNRDKFKKEFQQKWDACKTSEERTSVKKEFYSYKGKYTEAFLDTTWTLITAKFRREHLENLYDMLEILLRN